jgi:hypothetical protein
MKIMSPRVSVATGADDTHRVRRAAARVRSVEVDRRGTERRLIDALVNHGVLPADRSSIGMGHA